MEDFIKQKAGQGVTFYDYTKILPRYKKYSQSKLIHQTFSRSEKNDKIALDILKQGGNVAYVFYQKNNQLPEYYLGYRVVNGDMSDLRFLDEDQKEKDANGNPIGLIVGLSSKGSLKGRGSRSRAIRRSVMWNKAQKNPNYMDSPEFKEDANASASSIKSGNLMLILGVGALISVPIFKTVTHLPPYMGMLLGLGVLWVVSELINPDLDESLRKNYTATHALAKIDMPSVLFFLGILLAVGALQSMGTLANFAGYLSTTFGDNRIIITLIGLLSAVVDNVPLVAASMGMYSLETYPMDDFIWTYLAYCAGTGGSILIIGSAAGVAAMGMEKIEFGWYLKRISLLAALGYFAGAGVYLLMEQL
jgi:hypothetical protein